MNRWTFIARRLVQAVPTVLGVTILTFFMIHLVPGDPALSLLGPRATPELVAELHRDLGLDRSLEAQYWLFMRNLCHGDLGSSLFLDASVRSLVAERIPATFSLLAMGTVMTVLLTVPLAALAAVRPGGVREKLVRSLPIVGMGMPPFWVGVMLILVFAIRVPVLPVGGWGEGFFGHLSSLVLPSLAIALSIVPMTIRSLLISMQEVLRSEYVVTARAKGVSSLRLVMRHVLRNASMPALSVLSVNVGWLIGGTVVVEQVFAIPGLGQLMFMGVTNRDFAVVQGLTLVFAVAVVLTNLITDVIYSAIDPRVVIR